MAKVQEKNTYERSIRNIEEYSENEQFQEQISAQITERKNH